MSESESKHEKFLKKAQLWIAVLVGVITLVVGAYNAKNVLFAKKGAGAVSLHVHTEDGKPLAKATISIEKTQGGIIATSDSDSKGEYELAKIEPGSYMLKVNKAGYQPETLLFAAEAAQTTDLEIKLKLIPSTIRNTMEEVGASWLKSLGTPKK